MNLLAIVGNLTRDPESRTTNSGKTVCTFTVAVNRQQKDQNGQNVADFFRVSAWGQMGENCQKYLAKGRKVAVNGSVSLHTYQAQDGTTKASLEVFANNVEFLTPKSDGGSQQNQPTDVTAEMQESLPF